MIPHHITDTGLTFIAKGRPYTVARDFVRFDDLVVLLKSDIASEDLIVETFDAFALVRRIAGTRMTTHTDGRMFIDGEGVPDAWTAHLSQHPTEVRILLLKPGDRIRIEGDEDAPDGIYTVNDIDRDDIERSLYVEEEDFFGYILNTSVKDIL